MFHFQYFSSIIETVFPIDVLLLRRAPIMAYIRPRYPSYKLRSKIKLIGGIFDQFIQMTGKIDV